MVESFLLFSLHRSSAGVGKLGPGTGAGHGKLPPLWDFHEIFCGTGQCGCMLPRSAEQGIPRLTQGGPLSARGSGQPGEQPWSARGSEWPAESAQGGVALESERPALQWAARPAPSRSAQWEEPYWGQLSQPLSQPRLCREVQGWGAAQVASKLDELALLRARHPREPSSLCGLQLLPRGCLSPQITCAFEGSAWQSCGTAGHTRPGAVLSPHTEPGRRCVHSCHHCHQCRFECWLRSVHF